MSCNIFVLFHWLIDEIGQREHGGLRFINSEEEEIKQPKENDKKSRESIILKVLSKMMNERSSYVNCVSLRGFPDNEKARQSIQVI